MATKRLMSGRSIGDGVTLFPVHEAFDAPTAIDPTAVAIAGAGSVLGITHDVAYDAILGPAPASYVTPALTYGVSVASMILDIGLSKTSSNWDGHSICGQVLVVPTPPTIAVHSMNWAPNPQWTTAQAYASTLAAAGTMLLQTTSTTGTSMWVRLYDFDLVARWFRIQIYHNDAGVWRRVGMTIRRVHLA